MVSLNWKNKNSNKPELLLGHLRSVTNVKSDGSISFNNLAVLEETTLVLTHSIKFPKATREIYRNDVVKKSIFKWLKSLGDETKFLDIVGESLQEELSKGRFRFYVVTSLSVDQSFTIPSVCVNGVKLSFQRKCDDSLHESRVETINSNFEWMKEHHSGFTYVTAELKSRSSEGAYSRAMEAIDLVRGISNLICQPNFEMTLSGPGDKPVNRIRLGQTHSVHDQSGQMLSDKVWHESNYQETSPFRINKPEAFAQEFYKILDWLKNCDFNNVIEQSLIKYVRAFDSRDSASSLVNAWGALEIILAKKDMKYERMVSRLSFLYEDYEYNEAVLDVIKDIRNDSIHNLVDYEGYRHFCLMVARYYKNLISFLYHVSKDWKSLDELHSLLDMPKELADIKRRGKLLRETARFRRLDLPEIVS